MNCGCTGFYKQKHFALLHKHTAEMICSMQIISADDLQRSFATKLIVKAPSIYLEYTEGMSWLVSQLVNIFVYFVGKVFS